MCVLVFRLNARPYSSARTVGAILARPRLPKALSRPWARPAGPNSVAATVRAMGKGDWTMMMQNDIYVSQRLLGKKLNVPIRELEDSASDNVKVLSDNRAAIIEAMEAKFGMPCDQIYYNISGAILRALYLMGSVKKKSLKG